jgi:hypothetical protein
MVSADSRQPSDKMLTAGTHDDVPGAVVREDLTRGAGVDVTARAARRAVGVVSVAPVLDVLGHVCDIGAGNVDLVVVVVADANGGAANTLGANAGTGPGLAAAGDAAQIGNARVDRKGVYLTEPGLAVARALHVVQSCVPETVLVNELT